MPRKSTGWKLILEAATRYFIPKGNMKNGKRKKKEKVKINIKQKKYCRKQLQTRLIEHTTIVCLCGVHTIVFGSSSAVWTKSTLHSAKYSKAAHDSILQKRTHAHCLSKDSCMKKKTKKKTTSLRQKPIGALWSQWAVVSPFRSSCWASALTSELRANSDVWLHN